MALSYCKKMETVEMKDTVIIDYGMGNLSSIQNMAKYLGYEVIISSDFHQIANAEKLILPGVGNFGEAMRIINKSGLREILDEAVLQKKTPIFGICLGMQLLSSYSEEGNCEGFNWIQAQTRKFEFSEKINLKIPHMGWDFITVKRPTQLLSDIEMESRYYFVHSYYVKCQSEIDVVATTNYGIEFDAVIKHENIMGTQFHPEKSHRFGMKILKNYLEN